MNEPFNKDFKASVEVKNGRLSYIIENNSSIEIGDTIAAYVDDHEIGREKIELSEDTGFKEAVINIINFPEADLPVNIRSLVLDKNIELPIIAFREPEDVIANIGWQGSSAKIKYIDHNKIDFEVKVYSSPQYSREFILFINGEEISAAKSTVFTSNIKPRYRIHNICFEIKEKIKENDNVKLYDRVSSELVIEKCLNWFVFSSIFYDIVEEKNINMMRMQEELRTLRNKLDLTSSMILENHGLERIDIYYALLNRKIERLALSQNKVDDISTFDQPIAFAEQTTKYPIVLNASQIEGVGVYHLEVEKDNQWRWLAPRVTIAFRGISPEIKTIAMCFSNFSPESNCKGIIIDINGRSIKIDAMKNLDRWELHIPLSNYNSIDSTSIVHIQFKDFIHPDGDQRLLSAVLSHVYYQT
jgi:hypothetical protein